MKKSFIGEIVKATCACHAGQVFVMIFLLHPDGNLEAIAQVPFKNDHEAAANIDSILIRESQKYLKSVGLNMEDASEIKYGKGKDADKLERQYINENNPNLN